MSLFCRTSLGTASHAGPNTLAENPGHAAIQASSSSPGHWPLESPPLLLLLLLTLLLLLLPDKALGVWNSFLASAFCGVLMLLLFWFLRVTPGPPPPPLCLFRPPPNLFP